VLRVRNCAGHVVLGWHHAQGTLPSFLAKIFDQSLEKQSLTPATPFAGWVVSSGSGLSAPSLPGAREDPDALISPKV
jgi:hypothetical protein